MAYWLVKQEPSTFSWADHMKEGTSMWDGVRNYQARNNLDRMAVGDHVLFYHSVSEKQVVGVSVVERAGYPDHTADNPDKWVAVDLKALEPLPQPVTLDAIKADDQLQDIALVKQSRLSVMPLTEPEFMRILALGGLKPDALKG